jgi:ParB family chromosome partitioning protein
VVRELTDAELVIAQGKENSDRRDLSFIERALFALSLQERGFDRSTAMSALSVDKGDLSRLLAVAKAIPVDIILAVGPAPKVGRARWMQFADAFQKPGAKKMAEKAIRQNSFRSSDTNSRIDVLIAALQPRSSAAPTKICFTPDGKAIGRIERGARSVRFATDDLAFGSYLAEAMPRIYAEFVAYAGPLELETGGVEGQPEDR